MLGINVKYYRYILLIVFFTGVVISPFVFWPWVEISFEIPKVWFISRWIEILGITSLLFFPVSVKESKTDLKLVIITIVFLLYIVLSAFFGVDIQKSFWGNYYRADGIFTLIHLVIFFLLTVSIFENNLIDKTMSYIALSSGFLSVFTVFNAIFLSILKRDPPFLENWSGAIGFTFGNPNFLAGFLIITLPFVFYLLKKTNSGYFKFIMVIQIISILLTRSWSGIFGILLFILGVTLFTNKKRIIPLLATIFILIVSGISYFYNYPSRNSQGILVAESRERIFIKGILSLAKKPILGWGWANYDYAFENSDWPIKINGDVYVDKAHSTLLEIMVTTGLIGIILYLTLVARIFYNLFYSRSIYKNYLLLALTLFIIHSQTNIISISEELIFWLIAGISAKIYRGSSV